MKKSKQNTRRSFKPGTVVVFDEKTLNSSWWDGLTEKTRKDLFGPVGYGLKEQKHFVFLTEILNAPGHCVLLDVDTNKVLSMYHTENFREARDDEF